MSQLKTCPNCGASMTMPDINGYGDRQPPFRSCSCTIQRQGSPTDISHIYTRLSKLEDWMDIMLHLIPNGKPSSPGYCGPELCDDNCGSNKVSLPPQIWEAVKKYEANLIAHHRSEHPKDNLFFTMCPYCGMLAFSYREPANGFGDPDAFMFSYITCYKCREVKTANPQMFEWVTRILTMAFRSIMLPPQETGPLITRQRNILL